MAVYDTLGATYGATRKPDPRIAARITAALGEVGSVVNVGAGTGGYEPPTTVLAVEPSATMIAQRPAGAAPAVRAVAESLPLADASVEAALAVLTVHHWTDVEAGLSELLRVARRRIVLMTWDQSVTREFWLLREYFPEAAAFDDKRAIPVETIATRLGARVETVPVPHDCTDGFLAAYWRRPAAYLDPVVRAGASGLAQPGEEALRPGLARLRADLDSGAWQATHADLLTMAEYDGGYRLLVADL
ncbi:class I SAM-dependent methyltransferase [Actinokineospora guangxiensis]|uniref:Class I SAM-dependent methyltransferase n=1 Tax=Actinokineospora guangxiensis TaxID=1490288 RepID=A0ABW0EUH5_9PSEU